LPHRSQGFRVSALPKTPTNRAPKARPERERSEARGN
jgi:hypothetical protein